MLIFYYFNTLKYSQMLNPRFLSVSRKYFVSQPQDDKVFGIGQAWSV